MMNHACFKCHCPSFSSAALQSQIPLNHRSKVTNTDDKNGCVVGRFCFPAPLSRAEQFLVSHRLGGSPGTLTNTTPTRVTCLMLRRTPRLKRVKDQEMDAETVHLKETHSLKKKHILHLADKANRLSWRELIWARLYFTLRGFNLG